MRSFVLVLLLLLLSAYPAVPAAEAGCVDATPFDCLASAPDWNGRPGRFGNAGATLEPGEPTCGGDGHHTVWLRLEVIEPGAADPFKLSFDAPFFADVAAYTRDGEGGLVLEDCASTVMDEEDGGPYQPSLFLPCAPGVHWIQVASQHAGEGGSFDLWTSRFWRFDLTMSEPCPFKHSVPEAPRDFRVAGGNGALHLAWSEPFTGGLGVPLLRYDVLRSPTCDAAPEAVFSTTTRSFTDAGLAPGVSRCYRVRAVNYLGGGPLTGAQGATTWTTPGAPALLSVTAGADGELVVTWAAPASDGGTPIQSYRLHRDGPDGSVLAATTPGASRSFTDAGLARGATYTYRLSALNAMGEGPLGAPRSGTTWQVPGAPRDVRIGAGILPYAEVTWAPPAEPSPFTHYRVYRASSASGTATLVGEVPSTATSFTDGSLRPLFPAHYEVRAVNPAGEGAASARGCGAWPATTPATRC